MYSNDPNTFDDIPALDEHAIQLTGQLYRDGQSELQVDDLNRNRPKVQTFTRVTKFHRDRIESLRLEVQDNTDEYSFLEQQEHHLKRDHNRLLTLRNERRGIAEWSYDDKQFVQEISRMDPPLLERLATLRQQKSTLSEQSLKKIETLTELENKVAKSQLQPQFADAGSSLGRREFYNQKRTVHEILFSLTELLQNFHTIRYDKCCEWVVEMVTAMEEANRIRPTSTSQRELTHYEDLQRELVRMKRVLGRDDKPHVSRLNLLLVMARALPTDSLLNKHRSRVITESRWGDKDMKASLNSNSLQASPSVAGDKGGKGPNKKNQPDGKGKGKRTDAGDAGGAKDAKKVKRDVMCSLCGPTSGHSDMHCYQLHTTAESKVKIDENRRLPEMRKHFKQLDFATRKRGTPVPQTAEKS